MKAVVLVSADAEWRAVRELFPASVPTRTPFGERFDLPSPEAELIVMYGGWGKIAAAASAQWVLDHLKPDLLLNLGTCGGIRGRIAQGEVLLVTRALVYDLIEQMTDGEAERAYYTTDLDLSWMPTPWPHPVQSGLMVSADRDLLASDIPELVTRHGALAADWESAALAWVAQKHGARLLILRAVSDLVDLQGGEAYGQYALFETRTREVMARLFRQLPDWLARAHAAIETARSPTMEALPVFPKDVP